MDGCPGNGYLYLVLREENKEIVNVGTYLPLFYYKSKNNGFQKKRRYVFKSMEKKRKQKAIDYQRSKAGGKTTLISDFAKNYKYAITLNLEKPNDRRYFEDFDDVNTIVEALPLSNKISSLAFGDTLLFIDEIQESPKAILLQISLLH